MAEQDHHPALEHDLVAGESASKYERTAAEEARDPGDVSRAPDPRDEANPPAWRQDFPIDWSKDEFGSRRDFAKFMVLTSCAFAAGQGWIAVQQLVRGRREPPARLKIGSLAALAPGAVQSFAYPTERDRCLLVRLPDGELVAFSQACTHLSCAVVPKVAEGVFLCPCHEGYFDLRTGKNIAGPPPRPLPKILLEVSGDEVFAVGVDERTVG
ncbi:MAG TPA: Rieske 2Fe-2S domain-containing protein [Polyangiaceae bacterium]|jgi:nitrite reductase/ring-hydroxylating ferredoxin subunit|nr:Rieske 2Fe-2S domain-containing protein [Polyangiaceae bacterium]